MHMHTHTHTYTYTRTTLLFSYSHTHVAVTSDQKKHTPDQITDVHTVHLTQCISDQGCSSPPCARS